jgi:hypothetical protein
MSATDIRFRLDGLEPDNVLAFLALLGLLRALDLSRPEWRARAAWDVGQPPLRPLLLLSTPADPNDIARAAAEGVAELVKDHVFRATKLAFSPDEAAAALGAGNAPSSARQKEASRLWSALISDAAIRTGKDIVERTPFCLLDVAQTSFLKTLGEIGSSNAAPRQGRKSLGMAEAMALALFAPWARSHQTPSFRWDPAEDSRHALRWAAPTDDKQGVEHGANLLAACGLRSLTVVPQQRGAEVRLAVIGGDNHDGFSFAWPIWAEAMSLSAIEALLSHPSLREPDKLAHLSVSEVRVARKFNPGDGKYSNFGRGRPPATGNLGLRARPLDHGP